MNRHRPWYLAVPLAALLVACGGPAPELSLTGPSSAAVIWGDASPVELTLTRNETAIDEVTLSVDGLPEGVTATFEPATIAGDALSATLHLEAARNASGASALVTVRATGPEELVAEHVFALDVGGLTVEGSVETYTGEPLPRPIMVKVGTQRVATDAQGHFVAHEVAVPYDLVLSGEGVTEIYTDLRSATPHVRGFLDMSLGQSDGHMDVTGTVTPTPAAGERVTVCVSAVSPDASRCRTVTGNGSANSFTFSVPLVGEPSESRQIIARREVLDGDGQSVGYTGYAEAALSYTPGATQVIDLVLQSSSSTPVSFSLDSAGAPTFDLTGAISYGAFLNSAREIAPDVLHVPEAAQGMIIAVVGDPTTGASVTVQPVTGPLVGPITFATPVPMISPANGALLTEDVAFVLGDPAGALVSHTFMTSEGGFIFLHTFGERLEFAELATHVDGLSPADIGFWLAITAPDVTTPEQALGQPVGYVGLSRFLNAPSDPSKLTQPLEMALSGQHMFPAPGVSTAAGNALLGPIQADLFR